MIRRAIHLGVSDDLDAVLGALAPVRGRVVALSAHGAGEAAFALAAAGATEVVAVDLASPRELALIVELKRAAWALFGREDALVVCGLRPASALRRKALARQLLSALRGEAAEHWRARRAWIEGGLFHQDAVAVATRALLTALRALASSADYAAMIHGATPDVRRAAFDRAVGQRWIDRLFALAGGRINVFFPAAEWRASEYPRALTRDPRPYLEGLVASGLATNPLFAHLVYGPDAVLAPELLPPTLRPGAYDELRARAARVDVRAAASRLQLPLADRTADAAYLSNVVDYLDPAERAQLFRELRRALTEDAPILVCSNEAYPKVPVELGFRFDDAGSRAVAAADRAHVYRRIELYRASPARRLRVVECA